MNEKVKNTVERVSYTHAEGEHSVSIEIVYTFRDVCVDGVTISRSIVSIDVEGDIPMDYKRRIATHLYWRQFDLAAECVRSYLECLRRAA